MRCGPERTPVSRRCGRSRSEPRSARAPRTVTAAVVEALQRVGGGGNKPGFWRPLDGDLNPPEGSRRRRLDDVSHLLGDGTIHLVHPTLRPGVAREGSLSTVRVFEIHADVNNYASLQVPAQPSAETRSALRFDGTPKAASWEPVAVRSTDNRLPRPDIFSISGGSRTLAFTKRSLQALGPMLEGSGELLPLDFEGETVFVLNVTPVREGLLDPENALLEPEMHGIASQPYRYAFLADRLPPTGVFQIREGRRPLCAEDVAGIPSFRRAVDEAGLTGLMFLLAWDPELAEAEQACRERLIQLLRDHPGEFDPTQLLAAAGVDPPPMWCQRIPWNEPNELVFRVYGEICKVPGVERIGVGMALKGTGPAANPPAASIGPPSSTREPGDLVALLEELGCHDPRGWAESQEREGLPRVAIYALMRSLWPNLIDSWRHDLGWLERTPAGMAARRLETRALPQQLGDLASAVAYSVVFDMLMHLDEEGDLAAPDDAPGWRLVETDPTGELTGRTLSGCLHELLLELDPSGRQGLGIVR
jgi:hypothetical protein